jgi:hypothetical protein
VISAIAWLVVANAASLLATRSLLRRIGGGQPGIHTLLFLLILLILISATVIVAGLGGFLTGPALGLLGFSTLAILLARRAHRGIAWPGFHELGGALWVPALIVATRLAAQVWFFAPYSEDVLSYHLPKVAEWVRAGGFTKEMGLDPFATFPAGFELIETWWVVFLHHDLLIEMAGIEFLLVGATATRVLAERLGLGPRASLLAALLYALIPGVHLQATSCLNDGAVAALVVATFALTASRALWRLILLPVGLGIGVKATFIYALPGILLLAWLLRREARPPATPSRGLTVLASLATATGLFWYARNAIVYGNPVFPMGEREFAVQTSPSLSSLIASFGALISERIFDRHPYGPYLDRISGWGLVAVSCGLVGLFVLLRADRRFRNMALAYGASLTGVFLMVASDDWNMRFVLFFPSLLVIAAAGLADRMRACTRLLWAGAGLQFACTLLPYDLPLEDFRKLAGQPWRERSAAIFFDAEFVQDAVGYFADDRGPAYVLYKPDFSRRVVYLRSKSADKLTDEAKREGVTFVYAAPTSEERRQVIAEGVRRVALRRVNAKLVHLE